MSLWIRTQDKMRLVKLDSLQLTGKKIKGFSQFHALGLTLGKYESQESAASALDSLQSKIKGETDYHTVFEMPAF